MSLISEDFPTPHAPETPMETGFGWTWRIMVATVFAIPLKFRKSISVSLSVHMSFHPSSK
jgi:hypothetical protein